ncbi:hypothetical protein HanRHA438_Chr09g0389111 [Helianthus annuus]|nr:hypothetical protein HanRHA438_Chr09g0389111 [Helianthus annuus]
MLQVFILCCDFFTFFELPNVFNIQLQTPLDFKMCFGYRAKIPLRTMKSFMPENGKTQNRIFVCIFFYIKVS